MPSPTAETCSGLRIRIGNLSRDGRVFLGAALRAAAVQPCSHAATSTAAIDMPTTNLEFGVVLRQLPGSSSSWDSEYILRCLLRRSILRGIQTIQYSPSIEYITRQFKASIPSLNNVLLSDLCGCNAAASEPVESGQTNSCCRCIRLSYHLAGQINSGSPSLIGQDTTGECSRNYRWRARCVAKASVRPLGGKRDRQVDKTPVQSAGCPAGCIRGHETTTTRRASHNHVQSLPHNSGISSLRDAQTPSLGRS